MGGLGITDLQKRLDDVGAKIDAVSQQLAVLNSPPIVAPVQPLEQSTARQPPSPTANPTPQPSVDLRSPSSQSAPDQTAMAPAAAQSPVPSLGQPPQALSSEPAPVQEATTPATEQSPVLVPSQPPQPAVEHKPRYVSIEKGQSLIRIARANQVPAAAIAAANHLESPDLIKAGSRLLIPDLDPPADQVVQASSGKTPVGPPHPTPWTGHFQGGFEPR